MFGFFKWLFGSSDPKAKSKYVWNDQKLRSLTKVALDRHAELYDIKLDRRKRKETMLVEFQKALKDKGLL